MKWKSLSHAQLFTTPWTIQSMEFSRPECSSWVAFPFFRGSSQPRSPTLQEDSLPAEPQGKPKNTGVGSLPLLQRIFPTQESTGISCIADRFFTNWAIREAVRSTLDSYKQTIMNEIARENNSVFKAKAEVNHLPLTHTVKNRNGIYSGTHI